MRRKFHEHRRHIGIKNGVKAYIAAQPVEHYEKQRLR